MKTIILVPLLFCCGCLRSPVKVNVPIQKAKVYDHYGRLVTHVVGVTVKFHKLKIK